MPYTIYREKLALFQARYVFLCGTYFLSPPHLSLPSKIPIKQCYFPVKHTQILLSAPPCFVNL